MHAHIPLCAREFEWCALWYFNDDGFGGILANVHFSTFFWSGELSQNSWMLTEDSTNDYLNDNWRPVSEALRPIITKTIEDILLGILNKIFHFIPAEYLISDIAKPADLYA